MAQLAGAVEYTDCISAKGVRLSHWMSRGPVSWGCRIHWLYLCREVLFTNPSARAGYDTRSVFKRSLTGLNSEFSFS